MRPTNLVMNYSLVERESERERVSERERELFGFRVQFQFRDYVSQMLPKNAIRQSFI
jgi:hypothetical protein